jgi:hypothetical protein
MRIQVRGEREIAAFSEPVCLGSYIASKSERIV